MDMAYFGTVNYAIYQTPIGYKCYTCSATGVKLWRQYQTFLEHQDLLCASCAAKEQNIDISTMNIQGLYQSELLQLTDQIGWYVPAIPTEQGDTFWGYFSIPQAGCLWWQNLPNKL